MAIQQANSLLESILRDVMNIALGKAFYLDGAQFNLLPTQRPCAAICVSSAAPASSAIPVNCMVIVSSMLL
jgi:hypothetical protein